MFDIENLEKFIVIPTGSASPDDVDDLRQLDGDYPTGVYALWSDENQTIVAFAFDALKFDEEGARAWLSENIVAVADEKTIAQAVADGVRAAMASFMNAAANLIDIGAVTIDDRYYVSSGRGADIASDGARAWEWTTAKEDAIIDAGGWAQYAKAHLVVDLDQAETGQKWPEVKAAYTYPVAELIDGDLSFVLSAAQAVYSNLGGGQATPDLPGKVREATLETVKRIYRRFGHDTDDMALRGFGEIRTLVQAELDRVYGVVVQAFDGPRYVWIMEIGTSEVVFEHLGRTYSVSYEIDDDDVVTLGDPVSVSKEWVRPDGSTILLYALQSPLGDGSEAEGDDGLIWKEIVRPGTFHKSNTGTEVEITDDIIEETFRAWEAGIPQYISVPSRSHHEYTAGIVPPEENTGFVDQLKMVGARLFGGFRFTDQVVGSKVGDGSIADCSVYLRGNVHHPETGELFPWALMHVLLTNSPLVQNLQPFGALPAMSMNGDDSLVHQVIQLWEVKSMTVKKKKGDGTEAGGIVQMTAQDLEDLAAYRILGPVQDVAAMAGQRQEIAQRGRDLAISEIVAALEGTVECDGIVQVDGRRHHPVVIASVEKALKSVPISDIVAAGEDGVALDVVIIDLVNSIPGEARLEIPAAASASKEPKGGDDSLRDESGDVKAEALTDEAIDALDEVLSGAA